MTEMVKKEMTRKTAQGLNNNLNRFARNFWLQNNRLLENSSKTQLGQCKRLLCCKSPVAS